MKPIQIALRKEFKELNKEMDDAVINCIVPRVQKIYTDFCEDNIKNLTEQRELLIDTFNKINKNCEEDNSEALNENIKDFLNYHENISKIVNNFNKTLDADSNKKFLDDFEDEIFKESKKICKKMDFIIFKAYKVSDMKMATMVGGYINSVIIKIADITNIAIKETISPYIDAGKLIVDEIRQEHKNAIESYSQYEDRIRKDLNGYFKNNSNKKIFDYKEMDKFLKLEGYEPIRQKGSHKVYTNGEKTTIVPQHTLGKGLSSKIQKQIK